MFGALAGNGLQITFPHHQVSAPAHLELELIFGVEQHPVAHLDGTDVATDPVHLTPGQPLGHLRRRRDDDAAAAPALALLAHEAHHHAVVEHLDLELAVGHGDEGSAPFGAAQCGPWCRQRRDIGMTEECPVRLPGRGSNSITGLTVSSLYAVAPLQALADGWLFHPSGGSHGWPAE
jgi:hypothetical protein